MLFGEATQHDFYIFVGQYFVESFRCTKPSWVYLDIFKKSLGLQYIQD